MNKYGVLTEAQWAEVGLIAFRFIDRMGDPDPAIDSAETICAECYQAITQYTDDIFNNLHQRQVNK